MNRRILSMFLVISILLCNFGAITANADTITNNTTKVSIYNASGEFIGEFESIQEFEIEYLGINPNQRGVGTWILTVAASYGVVSMFIDIAYVFTGVDVKTWVRNNVVVPFTEEVKNMKLYSVSGGITNPYPPNSYQYSQFNKTNYYWVVQ